VDLQAKTADEALKAAWQAYRPEATWRVKVTNDLPDRDGWSRLRDECLNANWFTSLNDARRKIEEWRQDYNQQRPHSSLGYLSPAAFARTRAGLMA
jgi:transposase InsO family protein